MTMKKWMAGLLMGLMGLAAQAEVTVSNLSVAQRPGTKLVDISYDVASTETNVVSVVLSVSNGTAAVSALRVTGDAGAGVATGPGKSMVWDMAAEWNGRRSDAMSVQVAAYDGLSCPEGGDTSAVFWEVVNNRWVKNIYADGTITMSDRLTNLMWLYYANPCGRKIWDDAMAYCGNLVYAGHDDWFLPNRDQLIAVSSQKDYFSGVVYYYYWSSYSSASLPHWAHCVWMGTGSWSGFDKTYSRYVWPVRSQH